MNAWDDRSQSGEVVSLPVCLCVFRTAGAVLSKDSAAEAEQVVDWVCLKFGPSVLVPGCCRSHSDCAVHQDCAASMQWRRSQVAARTFIAEEQSRIVSRRKAMTSEIDSAAVFYLFLPDLCTLLLV